MLERHSVGVDSRPPGEHGRTREVPERAKELFQSGAGEEDWFGRMIEQAIGPLEDYANSAMQEGTAEIARAVVEEFKSARLPEGRPFQLEIEVRRSLLQIAERIDDGYNISVRVGELPPVDEEIVDDGADAETAADRELAERVSAVLERTGRSRELMNMTGSPILSLEMPPQDDEDTAAGQVDSSAGA